MPAYVRNAGIDGAETDRQLVDKLWQRAAETERRNYTMGGKNLNSFFSPLTHVQHLNSDGVADLIPEIWSHALGDKERRSSKRTPHRFNIRLFAFYLHVKRGVSDAQETEYNLSYGNYFPLGEETEHNLSNGDYFPLGEETEYNLSYGDYFPLGEETEHNLSNGDYFPLGEETEHNLSNGDYFPLGEETEHNLSYGNRKFFLNRVLIKLLDN
ncbi:hypothetical protein J6590_027771 [Homalodisca vitripennis]|nr:hypothetical protein J6590_027771 [Homalodisca vitripennis]